MSKLVLGQYGTGWLRDRPDFRDYTPTSIDLRGQLLQRSRPSASQPAASLPLIVDLREWCSPIENQGALGACSAFAGAGLVEYAMRRAYNKHVNVSPLFLYKVTRSLMRATGDTGAYLRDMLKALALCGVPPEDYYPYDISKFDNEPSAFAYSLGQNYQAISYIRLDKHSVIPEELLNRIKIMLFAGFPSAFGFTVYDSIKWANQSGEIRFPSEGERATFGHAVCAVGYSDTRTIGNETGALLIRNSWGESWGENGYGWLPFRYILEGLAVDWWCVLKQEWLDTGYFGVI